MKIKKCRSCKSKSLEKLFSLGNMAYTGIFPKNLKTIPPEGILTLIICKFCNLVQLDRNFSSKKMYGMNYGYRTSLNKSMKKHIINKKKFLSSIIELKKNSIILDIGSNDGTFLNSFNKSKFRLIGIDPTIKKFNQYYKSGIIKSSNFFSYKNYNQVAKKSKASLITSFSMFYDLQNPLKFTKDIYKCLDKHGIWHFEQSYLLDMLNKNSYDTICHEHLEYYSIHSINYIMKKSKLKIIDIIRNDINGGSIAITAAKQESKYKECKNLINKYLIREVEKKINSKITYKKFYSNFSKEKIKLLSLIDKLKSKGKKIIGYGASTKGNVLLQWCSIDNKKIDFIYDINEDKNNTYTPGTNIPIYKNLKTVSAKSIYFLVLPWHFKDFILKKERNNKINIKKKFIFPLPNLIVKS
jgi:hypothetical protein